MKRLAINVFTILMVGYGTYMIGSQFVVGLRASAYADGYADGSEYMRQRCYAAHAARLRAEIPPVERSEIALAARKFLRGRGSK